MKRLLLIMMLALSLPATALSNVYFVDPPKFPTNTKKEDVQLWLTLKVKNKFHKWLSLKFDNEMRFNSDISEIGYIHTETGLVLHPPSVKWLSVGLNGRFILSPKKPKVLDAWEGGWEFRPSLGATFKGGFRDLAKFSNRTRMEIHVNKVRFKKWRLRNKSVVAGRVWGKKDKSVFLVLDDEFFFVPDGFSENRLRGQFDIWLSKNAGFAVYYQWQAKVDYKLNSEEADPKPSLVLKEEMEWTHNHGVGVMALLKF